MIFIVRILDRQAAPGSLRVVCERSTPATVDDGTHQTDLFCVGDDRLRDSLSEEGLTVVALTDGWYEDDNEGGVAVWSAGKHWEIRDTPFTVKSSSGVLQETTADEDETEVINVRDAILGSVP